MPAWHDVSAGLERMECAPTWDLPEIKGRQNAKYTARSGEYEQ